MTPLRQRMIEDMQVRNLSAVTQRVYVDQTPYMRATLANHRPYSVLRKFVNTSYIYERKETVRQFDPGCRRRHSLPLQGYAQEGMENRGSCPNL